ncbi:8897_t:CDS:2 [Scutellospora calospora]|uniref:8897_t:CDS:1 n=1 Tax=Scutellospora calospora TaxID=85575 RepID=A0ACA9K5T7_9GLOM|nr:8897_t:CDS:2 [Scutellospora calospora]
MATYQERLTTILSTKSTTKSSFSVFFNENLSEAHAITKQYYVIANDTTKTDSIQAVFDQAAEDCKTKDVNMVKYALMTFVTHHPTARKNKIRIPSLARRSPNLALPTKGVYTTPGPVVGDKPAADVSGEPLLAYWLEDPNLNEHHEHWHTVYTDDKVADPQFPNDESKAFIKDRQGELFIYMHRQMNARYIAERLGVGLGLTRPLQDFNEPIVEGYTPSSHLVDSSDNTPYSSRSSGLKMADVKLGKSTISVAETLKQRELIKKAIQQGHFDDPKKTPLTPDLLGRAIEAGLKKSETGFDMYTGFHNNGHIMIGFINFQNDKKLDAGVMGDVRVACRDPAFWRWHRHVDDLYKAYQEKLGPQEFNDCPPVKFASDGGIVLCFKDKMACIKGLKDPQQDEEATKWGIQTFKEHHFFNTHGTNVLETKMKQRQFTWLEDDNSKQVIQYVFPREWYYFFRVENTSNKWIEVDKFKQEIPANCKTVIARDCDRSSVVRQPPQKTIDELDDTAIAVGTEDSDAEQYCDCGWPFHMLLPRGKREGMKFKLFVFISDWEKDKVPTVARCGSLSFCGAEQPKDKYPDIRPMGYPFDRPFKDCSFEKTFAGHQNTCSKEISIRWVDNYPDCV